MAHHGLVRPTMDIDLLVDAAADNIALVRDALAILEDGAVLEMALDEVANYNVVRIADEVVVDLIASAAGVTLADLASEIEFGDLAGVSVPYPAPAALLRTKRTVRDKDVPDRHYLEALIRRMETSP
jgi:hypothetical protein